LISFAQLGIIFLVFIFGLRMEPERLNSVATESFNTAFITTIIMGFGTYIIGIYLGLDSINAIYFSIAASISSSLVGMDLIEDDLRADLLHGRLSESIHLIQDTFAIIFIIVTSAIASESFVFTVVSGIGVIALAVFIRSNIIDRIMNVAGDSQELTMLTALGILTTFVAVTELSNLSSVIGSFAAGLAMAKFPHNTESLETVKPLKDFFSAIFFVSLGSLITVPSLGAFILTMMVILGVVIAKPLLTAFYLIHIGYDHRTAYLTGLSLDQVSEFALMIGIQAFIAGSMAESLFHALVISAVTTMILSSYTSRYDEEIYKFLSKYLNIDENKKKIEDRTEVGDVDNHVILVGYGTQGKEIADAVKKTDRDIVVIENDPEKVTEAKKEVGNHVFGDAVDDHTWRAAKAEKADLIVSTVPSHGLSKEILSLDNGADEMLRTPEVDEAADLINQDAFFVEVPDLVASEQLIDHINQVVKDVNTKEELRRRNILDLRQDLEK
jgi:CPA2 family monovalent cation:H+ antiporter-2